MSGRISKIENYISDMGLTVVKEIPEDEIIIVSSPELGLKNLVIDLEGDNVIFYIEIGKIKENVDRVELYEMLLQKFNNATTGLMSTGQFGLKEDDVDTLVMSEQHLFDFMDYEEFEGMVSGFSNNLLLNIDLIKLVIETSGKGE